MCVPVSLCPVSALPSSAFQALGTITAVPVTGPQVSSLQRLAGQGVAVLPQVSGRGWAPGACLSVRPSVPAACDPSPSALRFLGGTPRGALSSPASCVRPSETFPPDPASRGLGPGLWLRE